MSLTNIYVLFRQLLRVVFIADSIVPRRPWQTGRANWIMNTSHSTIQSEFQFHRQTSGVIPDWKWSLKVITLWTEIHSFHGRWHCTTTSNKDPWHTVHGLNPIHVTTDVWSGLHGTHVHTNAVKWLKMYCGVLPVRVRGSVHLCCLPTVSTYLAIQDHHLGFFLEWIPDYCVSTLPNPLRSYVAYLRSNVTHYYHPYLPVSY